MILFRFMYLPQITTLIKMVFVQDDNIMFIHFRYAFRSLLSIKRHDKKSYDHTCTTLWRVHETSLTTFMPTMNFLIEIMFILKAIKFHFSRSYDKQNLTIVPFHINFMKLAKGSFHKFHIKFMKLACKVLRSFHSFVY